MKVLVLVIAILIIVLAAIFGYLFLGSNPAFYGDTNLDTQSKNSGLSAFQGNNNAPSAGSDTYRCVVEATQGGMDVTVHRSGRSYGQISMPEGAANFIYDGTHQYMWSQFDSGETMAWKFKHDVSPYAYDEFASGRFTSYGSGGAAENVKLECGPSSFDESRMVIPSNIEFISGGA